MLSSTWLRRGGVVGVENKVPIEFHPIDCGLVHLLSSSWLQGGVVGVESKASLS